MFRRIVAITIFLLSAQQALADDPLGIGSALGLSSMPAAAVSGASGVPGTAAIGAPSSAATPSGVTAAPPGIPPLNPSALTVNPVKPAGFDYSVNINSDVFGAQLFTGSFARGGTTQFNPDYHVSVGDKLQVRMWGAFNLDTSCVVDPQGNIFLPHVGPIKVLGVRNQELQGVVDGAIRRVFKANVFSYANLAAAQPVRVYVGGFVYRPGLYGGTSMDSILNYLDQAGGIDVERGSFLDIQIKRNGEVRATVNLYEFLLFGKIPQVQLSDGDVIFVSPRKNVARVSGLVENAKRFEFGGNKYSIADLAKVARPLPTATNVRITRNTGSVLNTEYYHLDDTASVSLLNGDEIEFTADKKPGAISVRVEGEHMSPQEYILPYGSRMGSLLSQITFNERSDTKSLQLFRLSVKDKQKQMLMTSLKSLESAALTARSGTGEEALLRKQEADLLLQWVDRAKTIEPTGQVYIADATQREDFLLENGDVIRVPTKDNLIMISGEVLFPNTLIYNPALDVDDYIKRAGGYTQNADVSRVVIAHRDGSFDDGKDGDTTVREGDQILVLPKIDTKARQFYKDITQVIYQIAVSAKIVFGL